MIQQTSRVKRARRYPRKRDRPSKVSVKMISQTWPGRLVTWLSTNTTSSLSAGLGVSAFLYVHRSSYSACSSHVSRIVRHILLFESLIMSPEIWLVWWTEAGNRQVGKYISVYIVLSVSAWIFRAGTIGYVSNASYLAFHLN
jgi:hypothetical protein